MRSFFLFSLFYSFWIFRCFKIRWVGQVLKPLHSPVHNFLWIMTKNTSFSSFTGCCHVNIFLFLFFSMDENVFANPWTIPIFIISALVNLVMLSKSIASIIELNYKYITTCFKDLLTSFSLVESSDIFLSFGKFWFFSKVSVKKIFSRVFSQKNLVS